MDIFDALHRANFDKLFSLDEEGRQAKEKLLREAGVPEELIADLCSPGIKPGMTLGGAKAIDVMTLVERVLVPAERRARSAPRQPTALR